jgi:hypothetical protein
VSNGTFTIAKGREAQYASLPGATDSLIAVLLRGVESDIALAKHDTLSALLAANTECNFTSYSRETLSSATLTVDDDAATPIADCADFDWDPAGGATNNTVLKLIVCYVPSSGAADSSIIPVWYWDSGLPITTDGEAFNVTVSSSGLWRTAEAS